MGGGLYNPLATTSIVAFVEGANDQRANEAEVPARLDNEPLHLLNGDGDVRSARLPFATPQRVDLYCRSCASQHRDA